MIFTQDKCYNIFLISNSKIEFRLVSMQYVYGNTKHIPTVLAQKESNIPFDFWTHFII